MKLFLKKDTTSKIVVIFIQNSSQTDGSGLTGLVHNTASLTCYYYREGAGTGATQVSLVDATLGTWTSGGFKVVDAANMPGVYELHLPNAVIATGANYVVLMLKGATNMAPLLLEIELLDNMPGEVADKTGYALGVGGIAASAFAAGAIDAAALAQDAEREIADEFLNRDIAGGASGSSRNVKNALRPLRNRARLLGGTLTVYQEDDTTPAWTAAATLAVRNPVVELDPA